MKILEINIYGYGKMENVKMNHLADFQVFYGPNEAGKSTIMSFIHSILFGFPTKQQNDLRYEPKSHTKYGGELIILHPTSGKVVIERVKGKATGDVIVKFEDGTIGGEEQLALLMKSIDKIMYQNIYSFNLNGLQNIHQVKGEDLGKFLFSAGAVGTDKLVKVENELKKELETRFKPGGKKPILNEQLKELQDLYGKVREAQMKNEEYSLLIDEKMNLEQSIHHKESKKRGLQTEINRIEEWKKLFPYVQEWRELSSELEKTNAPSFPLDGIKRLDALIQMMKPLEAQLSALQDKKNRLKEQLSSLDVNQTLLKHEAEIENVTSQISIYDQLVNESSKIEHQLNSISERLNELRKQLHFPLDENQLLDLDTSIFMKEKVRQAHAQFFRLMDQKKMLDHHFNEEKDALDLVEKEMKALTEQTLPEFQREKLGKQLKQSTLREQLQKDLREVQNDILYHQTTKRTEGIHSDKQKGTTYFLVLFFLVLGGWGGLKHQWFLLAITGIGLVILLFMTLKKGTNISSVKDELIVVLREKEKTLLTDISAYDDTEPEFIQSKIQIDDRIREQLQTAKIRYSQQQHRYEKVIDAFEEWETESRQLEESMNQLYGALLLPKQVPFERVDDSFQIITDMKEITLEKKKLLGRKKELNVRLNEIQTDIMKLVERFLPETKANLVELVFRLKEILKEEKERNVQFQGLQQKLEELQADIITVEKEHEYLLKEQTELFDEVGATCQEDFRSNYEEALKRKNLIDQKISLEKQLQMAGYMINDFIPYNHIHQLNELLVQESEQYQQLGIEVSNDLNHLADIKYQIAILEEGGTYSELLHRFKQKKYELEEQAKIWGTFATAKHILTCTIDRYKNEKLPLLLKKAEEYFSYLTMGEYVRIHSKKEGNGFLIERMDHTFFEANELSQATMEQVYVSIRLALATTLFEKVNFPILIDDSFVNFDEKRTERVLKLLSEIEGHQILFFTCHSHLLRYFREAQVYQMNSGKELLQQHL
ncbi:AAA family ATPase [Neobacillus sp. D3-1R]|uniref:AAA family ATPase n=1 Tax=Neobacillus sp. D3-1R TaxID=3445778 RepID=UPI003FA113D6